MSDNVTPPLRPTFEPILLHRDELGSRDDLPAHAGPRAPMRLVTGQAVDADDGAPFTEYLGVGVRASAVTMLTYELVVVPVDIGDAVRSAGGWLYDRVRAGWRVSMCVPEAADLRPLQILGITAFFTGDPFDVLRTSSSAALVVGAAPIPAAPQ